MNFWGDVGVGIGNNNQILKVMTCILTFFAYFQHVYNSATLLLLARCQHCNADDFSDER